MVLLSAVIRIGFVRILVVARGDGVMTSGFRLVRNADTRAGQT